MRSAVGHSLKRTFPILLMVVMTALIFEKAVYTHIHVLPDGSLVTHAHPYSKSSEGRSAPAHEHSYLEFFLLDQLDILILIIGTALFLKQASGSTGLPELISDRLLPAFVPFPPGRSPPVCI